MSEALFYHCDTLRKLILFEQELGVKDYHRIPLSKILHTLSRKGYLRTILWEKDVITDASREEALFYEYENANIDRLHFFSTKIDTPEDIRLNPASYGGYCDLRPKTRTVLSVRITENVVKRPGKETYAYICCSISHSAKLQAKDIPLPEIATFPCCEKDKHGVMCSQAAMVGLIEFWNYQCPEMFKTKTAIGINRKLGIPDKEVKEASGGRGLCLNEIYRFFRSEGVNVLPLIYEPHEPDIQRNRCRQDIYGFIESGFPVLVCLQFSDKEAHALLCLGHTYDRNSWVAMADIGYFAKYSSGQDNYHANTTWIRNFIVHDDNFGPYYFMPTDKVEELILGGFVVLPDDSIQIRPTDAADAAFAIIMKDEVANEIDISLSSGSFAEANKVWLIEFVKHMKVDCGDGLVLRPVILKGREINALYEKHEFNPVLEQLTADKSEDYFWYIEITWPDIYCHHQECCGSAIIEASTDKPIMLHLPGICIIWEGSSLMAYKAENEDAPRRHFREK